MSLLGFLKSTSSIGYAVTESMHQLILMLGNTQCHVLLAWTIGAEDDASIKSSVGEPSRPSRAATLVPQEQQCSYR